MDGWMTCEEGAKKERERECGNLHTVPHTSLEFSHAGGKVRTGGGVQREG